MTSDELLFAIFCIENVAESLHRQGDEVYRLLSEQSTLLDDYIIPYYDVLHTQGKEYIVHDIIENMQAEGLVQ
jgi:hypothetical protein